jgi:DNA polymerase III subunit delta'
VKVIGHETVKATLRGFAGQTLLFCGPERVGRRLLARWYAAWLNCLKPQDEPCGRCESCLMMAHETHPDYREIAPERLTKTGRTSRRPQLRIDELVPREGGHPEPLSRWLETRPRGRWRVGVVDHAEMINVQAANAFLKTLEEPASYAKIVLIAPSPEAVLPTIASRSTVVRFAAISSAEEHPLARLGRVGDLIAAEEEPDAFREALEVVDSYLLSLPKSLDEAFTAADRLEKHLSADLAELLRARLSAWPPVSYAEALAAVEKCERALEVYASAPLAVQVLTLELRRALKATP